MDLLDWLGSVAAARLSAKHATMGMLSSLMSPAETSDSASLLKHNMVVPPMTLQRSTKNLDEFFWD
jgi:hypothetical protein